MVFEIMKQDGSHVFFSEHEAIEKMFQKQPSYSHTRNKGSLQRL
jgi:hypothetical protein